MDAKKGISTLPESDVIYFETNQQRLSRLAKQKFDCPCGGKYTKARRLQHQDTKKHVKWFSSRSKSNIPLTFK